ncbi:MAG TPA: nuclear transport factor 2 family protein [Candidatus Limnocylindrales bacterium]
MIDQARGGDLLDALANLVTDFDGDRLVALFAERAELRPDPFADLVLGRNDIRAYWASAVDAMGQPEVTVERHWVSGDTVLASWHASYVSADHSRTRLAGFVTIELVDGSIERLKVWSSRRSSAGF